jgi:hypothetical protein
MDEMSTDAMVGPTRVETGTMQVYGGNYTRILDHPEEMREFIII